MRHGESYIGLLGPIRLGIAVRSSLACSLPAWQQPAAAMLLMCFALHPVALSAERRGLYSRRAAYFIALHTRDLFAQACLAVLVPGSLAGAGCGGLSTTKVLSPCQIPHSSF